MKPPTVFHDTTHADMRRTERGLSVVEVQTNFIIVKCKTPPTVEIDTEASAAYVRFRRAKVAKTLRHSARWPIVTIDVDARGQVVGVEFVGVKKFNRSIWRTC